MQNIMHKDIAIRAEIMLAIGTPVPTERTDHISFVGSCCRSVGEELRTSLAFRRKRCGWLESTQERIVGHCG